MKREYLMLAHIFKNFHAGWFASEKLDGHRAWWDGGVSRGDLAVNVPYANTIKDKKPIVATGLWSRRGKVVWAPDWWLDELPQISLDGELWSRQLTCQQIGSIVRSQRSDDRWKKIKYMVFDSPDMRELLGPGEIYMGKSESKWIIPEDAYDRRMPRKGPVTYMADPYFSWRYEKLLSIDSHVAETVIQMQVHTEDHLQGILREIYANGGEGVMLRNPDSGWYPQRSWDLLKIKDARDDEAVIVGTVPGKGRLEGMIGALVVRWRDKVFEIGTGLNDFQRSTMHNDIGKVITFRYRELTLDGIPKEARFLRLREDL